MKPETKIIILDALKALLETVGSNRYEVAELISETVQGHHRTTQQAFWSVLLLAQIDYASALCDDRNLAAVQLANKVKALARANNYDVGLPRI